MDCIKSGQKELEYQLLLDNSQEIILFFDSTGRIINYNKKAKEELGYGDDIRQLQISQIFKDAFQYNNNVIVTDSKFLTSLEESMAYRKNQTCFPVELNVGIKNINHIFIGICTAVNITDKKKADRDIYYLKKELNSNNQISGELVAKVAHELRTPLNGIMGFIGNLMDTDLKPDQIDALNIMKKCSANLNRLVNELMDFAKISNKKLFIEPIEFKFYDFIQHILDINIGHINEKGLKFFLYISDDLPEKMIGDEFRLGQILNNLFSNAIKFTTFGQINLDIVKVIQTDRDIELLFMMTDTGIGMDELDKDKLFKSFFQIDSLIARKYGGTGLGLSICKSLVEMMNGTITFDSVKNKGSTFSFTVQLGIPRDSETISFIATKRDYDNANGIDKETKLQDIIDKAILNIDYINKKQKNIDMNKDNAFGIEKNTTGEINDMLEQLLICIEIGNWEKSEQLAYRIKNLHLNTKDMLRLLMAIRREDYDVSLSLINAIRQYLS